MTHLSIAIRPAPLRPQLALGAAGVATILVGAHVANDALTSMLSGLLPTLQTRYGLADTELALLVATLALSASVSQPVLGALSDRFGARRLAAMGTAFGISMLSLMTVAPNTAVLFGLLLLGGLGSAAFHPAATSLLAATPLRRRELGVGLFSAGGTVGLALGPVVVLLAAATLGLGFVPWLIVPAIALGGLIFLLVPAQPGRTRAEGTPILDATLLRGRIGALAGAATLGSVAFVAFTSAYPLFLVRDRGIEPTDPLIGLTLAAFNLGAAGGAVLAGLVGNRVDRRMFVAATLLASLVPLGLLLVIAPSGPLYVVTVAAAGALLNANLPILLVVATQLAPNRAAAASGMLMGAPVGLAGLLYVLVGWLQQELGLQAAMGIAFLGVLPGAAIGLIALRGNAAIPPGVGPPASGCPAAPACRLAAPTR